MDANVLFEIVKDYGPNILAVALIVITTLAQKSNLLNGLKTIVKRADELKVAAEFKDVQDKMQGLMMTIEAQEKQIQDLTDSINKITRPNNDRDNKEI